MANGKAKITKGGRKMSKGKGNVVKGPPSLVHEKAPNGRKTKVSGKTATGSLPRSKVKIQRSKVARSKVGLNDIIYTWVSSSKQVDQAGSKHQQNGREVTARKTKTVRTRTRSPDTIAEEQLYEFSKKTKSRLFPWSGCNMGWQGQKQKASHAHIPAIKIPRFEDNPGASEAKTCYCPSLGTSTARRMLSEIEQKA